MKLFRGLANIHTYRAANVDQIYDEWSLRIVLHLFALWHSQELICKAFLFNPVYTEKLTAQRAEITLADRILCLGNQT